MDPCQPPPTSEGPRGSTSPRCPGRSTPVSRGRAGPAPPAGVRSPATDVARSTTGASWRTNCSSPLAWRHGVRPDRHVAVRRTATGGSTSPPAGSVAGAWPRPGPPWPGRLRSRTPGPTPPERRTDRIGPGRPGGEGATVDGVPSLAERLGYADDAKLLILNCDDLGFCHAANVGVYQALRDGLATERQPDGPLPVGPGRGRRLPGRRRRGAPHRQRRVRPLPVGPDHPRPVAARRRRRVPPHGRGRLGPRRSRRGAARVPGPDRTGHPVGLRRQPPRRPHGHHADQVGVLRRLPRPRRGVQAAPAALGGRHRGAHRVPLPVPGRRGGGGLPRRLRLRARGRAAARSSSTPSPGSSRA